MIISSITYDNIIREFRKTLITVTGLPGTRVLDTLSARGPELSEIISSTASTSFELCDVFIIFELIEDANSENNIILPDVSVIDSLTQYDFNLKIYGSASHQMVQQIRCKLRDSEIVYSLREKGIYINGIPQATAINEIINDTMWPRCDMTIKLWTRYSIENSGTGLYADQIPETAVEPVPSVDPNN